MKAINIFLIILLGIIFTACSNKQVPIKKEIKKTIKVQKKIDNYKKAMSYEDKNPKAYYKAFKDYENPIGKKEFKEINKKVQKELIDNYAKKALNGTLSKNYVKYDDRWVELSQSATNLAMIEYSEGDKELAGYYLALAKKIIKSTPLNKERYYRYELNKNGEKLYYHHRQRNKIIDLGSGEIFNALLKII